MAIKTSRRPRPRAGPTSWTTGASVETESGAPPGQSASSAANAARAAGLATKATLFIHQAASVLEREVAAGIRAAQTLENKVMDVRGLRSGSPDDLMQKAREHVRAVGDILMDLVALGVRGIEDVAQRAVRIKQPVSAGGGATEDRRDDLPTLSPDGIIQPGDTAVVELALENAGDDVQKVVGFQVSDLIAPDGARIKASLIHFAPLPLPIPPHGKARVKISIHVPRKASAGIYSGLMMAERMLQVRALIVVEVAEAGARAAE